MFRLAWRWRLIVRPRRKDESTFRTARGCQLAQCISTLGTFVARHRNQPANDPAVKECQQERGYQQHDSIRHRFGHDPRPVAKAPLEKPEHANVDQRHRSKHEQRQGGRAHTNKNALALFNYGVMRLVHCGWHGWCSAHGYSRRPSLIPKQVALGEHALAFEIAKSLIHTAENLRCGFGDERRRVFLGLPHHVHLLGVLPGVLKFAFDAAR